MARYATRVRGSTSDAVQADRQEGLERISTIRPLRPAGRVAARTAPAITRGGVVGLDGAGEDVASTTRPDRARGGVEDR